MKVKRILGLVMVIVFCIASSTTAFAAGLTKGEKSIINRLKAGVVVNGQVIKLPASYVNQAENELMKNKRNITDSQAAYIIKKIDEAEGILQKEGITSLAELKNSQSLKKIVQLAKEAAGVVDSTVAYNTSKSIVSVKNSSGKTVFTNKKIINQTGFDLSGIAFAGCFMITSLAACIFITHKKKLFVNEVVV